MDRRMGIKEKTVGWKFFVMMIPRRRIVMVFGELEML